MKLLPLNIKKKISKRMNWFRDGSVILLLFTSFFGSMIGLITYERLHGPGGSREKTEMQAKVTHLLNDYHRIQSLDTLMQTSAGTDVGLDIPRAQIGEKKLKAGFDQEAQATGVALAHARNLSIEDRYELYRQVGEITPLPDYFKKVHDDDAFLRFSRAQAKVMDRPGFTPTVATAREIISDTPYNGVPLSLAFLFGPTVLSAAGAFGFSAARKRFDKSIVRQEEDELKAAQAALQAAAARDAADAAERERLSKLPAAVATALDRDISVRQIKLAGRDQPARARQPGAGGA